MDLSNVRVLVVGPRGSGKTTFTLMLRNELDCCAWFETGEALIQFYARVSVGTSDRERVVEKLAHIRTHKDSYRRDLIEMGDVLREIDPAGLIRYGFGKAPIVAGARRRSELNAYCAAGRTPGIDSEILIEICKDGCAPDNYELSGAHSDPWKFFTATIQVPNNGDREDLRKWARLAAKTVRGIARK